MHFLARVSFLGLLLACAGAQAQVQEEIRRCASIPADSERLACYDRLFRDPALQSRAPAAGAAAGGAAASGAAAAGNQSAAAGGAPAGAASSGANPAGAAAAGAASGAASSASAPAAGGAVQAAGAAGTEFGTNPRLQEQQRRKESPGSAESQELRARITKVDAHPYGLHVLTLENGQVWQQKEKVWELELKPGDAVVIRRGMLGSYRLQPDGQSISTAVVRVK